MYKKTIKYTDYNGVERTEDCYFNLNKAEMMELELTTVGGFSNLAKRLNDEQNIPQLTRLFKRLIFMSYGKRSDDGRRFIKSDELSTEFSQTEAYSELFSNLLTDSDAAIAFSAGIMPAEAVEEAKKKHPELIPDLPKTTASE